MDPFARALADAGGIAAPRERAGQLRTLLAGELQHGATELTRKRSGTDHPVTVAFAASTTEGASGLLAIAPVDPALRADPDVVPERSWLLVAALVGALSDAGGTGTPTAAASGDALLLHSPGAADPELAALAFEEQVADVDRLRARGLALPPGVLPESPDLRPPVGAAHPLVVAARVAALGGRPADPRSTEDLEDAVLAQLAAEHAAANPTAARPHEDPDPARRVARRILQRLDGMGKWGGYHTEFSHLARGFAGNDRALAEAVGEALLEAGLLDEKPSVGQRHVFLNPRRAGDIRALIDTGDAPHDLALP